MNISENISESCAGLLKEGRQFHPSFGGGFSNHMPMALIALDKMKAPSDVLKEFAEDQFKRLELFKDQEAPLPGPIEDSLGNLNLFTAYLGHYREKLAILGLEKTLRSSLPLLIPGISAAVFHPMIRLAYGVIAGDIEEAAYALAYWAAEYHPLGPTGEKTGDSLTAVWERVSARGKDFSFKGRQLTDRMKEAVSVEGGVIGKIQPRGITHKEIARLAIRTFLGANNFILLHGVTGCHALHVILPLLEDRDQALRYFWQAYIGAYLTLGVIDLKIPEDLKVPLTWEQITGKTWKFKDVHVIKIVYSCYDEYNRYGYPEYMKAAARAVL